MDSARTVRRLLAAGLAAASTATLMVGCGGGEQGSASGRPVVAATAPQIDGLLRALAGDGVQVASVVAATADVHELELRPSQVRALRDATVVFQPGRGNDAWAQEALDRTDATKIDLSAGLPGNQRHWWMDPSLVETAATKAAAELDRIDPAGQSRRAARLKTFVAELTMIDANTKRCLATVPASGRVIVTDHDAAGAYAERYGLTVAGTISPGAEPEAAPSAKRIAELERTMKARGVVAVFPIAPHGSELTASVAERGGAVLGEPLWADALPGTAHQHAGEDAGAEHSGEAVAPTLAAAALLNGEAVAEALGARKSACGPLLR